MAFRMIPISMTLNDLERRNSPYFASFHPILIALEADYVEVVEDSPKMSVEYRLPLLAKTDPPCSAVSLR